MLEMVSLMLLGKSKSSYTLRIVLKLNIFDRRHLVRLWLRDPEFAWETPEPLQELWDRLYKDVTEEEQVFPLEPRIRGGAGKSETPSLNKPEHNI